MTVEFILNLIVGAHYNVTGLVLCCSVWQRQASLVDQSRQDKAHLVCRLPEYLILQ